MSRSAYKGVVFGLLALAFSTLVSARADDVSVAQEFDRAADNQEQELAAAQEPINRRYQIRLEDLLARAKRSDDVDTVARIQQALDRLAVKPATLAALGPAAFYVGAWTYVYHLDGRSYGIDLNANSTCSQNSQRFGTWEVTAKFLVIRYDGHPDWQDRYELPIRAGALTAINSDGYTMAITRRGAPVPEALQRELLGTWNFYNLGDGKQGVATLTADGSYLVEAGRRTGSWAVSGDVLVISHGERDGGRDLYELPVSSEVMYGRNLANQALWLGRPTVSLPTRRKSGDTPIAPDSWSPAGRWQWHAGPDNTMTAEGRVLQHNKEVGHWDWLDQSKGQMQIHWKDGKYVDTLTLQPDGEHLAGRSSNGDAFTEARLP